MTKSTPWKRSTHEIAAGSSGTSSEKTNPALVPSNATMNPYLCSELLVDTMLEKYTVKMIKFGTNVVTAKTSVVDHKCFYQVILPKDPPLKLS